jgi:SAM-dependent methyltransferase
VNESPSSMAAEFDTVAAWTADVAADLGPSCHIPAGCRGSGSPGVLRWFLDRLDVTAGETFLDVGAGVGGPAAFAAEEVGAVPVLTDPEAGACRAAQQLFGLPGVQAGTQLPIATGSVGVGWSLGVLCTVTDQAAYLAELHRVLQPDARFGLLVYTASHPGPLRHPQPKGNRFPTEERLADLLATAGLCVRTSGRSDDFIAAPSAWQEATAQVEAELERRYGSHPSWRTASEQATRMGQLLEARQVTGKLLVVATI